MIRALRHRWISWRFNRLFVKPFEAAIERARKNHAYGVEAARRAQRAKLHQALRGQG